MCKDVRNSYLALFKQLQCGDGSIKALVAIARVQQCLATSGTKTDIVVSGELGDASRQASLIATARQAQRTLSAATRERLRVLGCRLSEAEARRGQDGQSLIDAAKQLDDFIKEIEQLWNTSDTANPAAQATALVATLRSATPPAGGEASTCKAPASDAAGLAQLDGTLGPLFQALAALKPGRALIGKLRAETESFRAGKLGDLLNVASDPAAALANPDATTGAHVVALVFGSEANINTIIQAARGTLPDTSGILIELAEARMRAAVSQAEGDRIGQLEHLLTLRVVAYRQEIAGLMAAIDASEGGPESRMLLTYSDSFQQGRVPVAVLERESQHVELVAWMQRERAAIEAAYTVLDTAAGQIKISTAGGIKTEDIARLLNVAGLAAIAGTN